MTMDTNIPSHITPLTWMEATSPLFQFSKHPNLLKRDLDERELIKNQ